MGLEQLIGFFIVATLLTITPGLDTALVLRVALSEGARPALRAGFGIATGLLIWGGLVGLGLGAVLAASEFAYSVLKWVGAGHLAFLGVATASNISFAA